MIEFDPEKEGRSAHGLGFELAADLFAGDFIEEPDRRFDYGEDRIKAAGPVAAMGGSLNVAIFTWRDGNRRVISFRKANDREAQQYRNRDA